MSRYEFRLPDIGEGTAEAECVAWHVAVGDRVEEDQLLLEVMTDKATVEVTSPVDGLVTMRTGEAGEMLPVGGVVLVFDLVDDGAPALAPAGEPPSEPTFAAATAAAANSPAPPAPRRVLTTPAVRRRAQEARIDLNDVRPTGPNGRVRQADLEAYLDGAGVAAASRRDVLPARSARAFASGAFDEVEVAGLRRRISERMQDTKRRIPHFSYIEEVDVSQIEALRMGLNSEFAGTRAKLTLLPFLVRALAIALPEFPHLNALFDDDANIVRRYRPLHAGIATQTPKGLVVTVVRDADALDVWALAGRIAALADLARAGKAGPADLSGSTLTITSLGAIGGLATTPVINSPEVAIVGVNKVIERPVVRGGGIAIAKMMNLSSSFDHRVVDGWDAALFVQRLKSLLENPGRLMVG